MLQKFSKKKKEIKELAMKGKREMKKKQDQENCRNKLAKIVLHITNSEVSETSTCIQTAKTLLSHADPGRTYVYFLQFPLE